MIVSALSSAGQWIKHLLDIIRFYRVSNVKIDSWIFDIRQLLPIKLWEQKNFVKIQKIVTFLSSPGFSKQNAPTAKVKARLSPDIQFSPAWADVSRDCLY